jgi:hypothetical protein
MIKSRETNDVKLGWLISRILFKISNDHTDFSKEIIKLDDTILTITMDICLVYEIRKAINFLKLINRSQGLGLELNPKTINKKHPEIDSRHHISCTCPVCYENMHNIKNSIKLKCNHTICDECFEKWYIQANNSSCPMCRNEMHKQDEYFWKDVCNYFLYIL